LHLAPSPPQISLIDEGELIVDLVDDAGTRLETQATRPISVMLTSGSALITDPDAPISAGSSSRRVKILPTGLKPLGVRVRSDTLHDADTTIQVVVPILLIVLTVGGGAVGSWVAIAQANVLQPATRILARVLIGIVVAFILYWGALFVGLEKLPRAAVLNPVTALAVAILGGYGGTSVLNAILKRVAPLGAGPSTQRTGD
jgi:hypothetical protein